MIGKRACADGVDNDGDGVVDYPADPGCADPADDDKVADCGADVDSDGDDACDASDNCLVDANPDQLDTNQDGYGNACDADYDGDGAVGLSDYMRLGAAFGKRTGAPGYDADLDADGDGAIGMLEFLRLGRSFGRAPGPSGLLCAGSIPCP
jgi:hypothetical protein